MNKNGQRLSKYFSGTTEQRDCKHRHSFVWGYLEFQTWHHSSTHTVHTYVRTCIRNSVNTSCMLDLIGMSSVIGCANFHRIHSLHIIVNDCTGDPHHNAFLSTLCLCYVSLSAKMCLYPFPVLDNAAACHKECVNRLAQLNDSEEFLRWLSGMQRSSELWHFSLSYW